jgi:ketosteroid isomerase-like protein
MSSTNLDVVRSIFAAWERGDFSSVEWAHPEIEYVYVDGPHPGTWTGLAEMARANRDFLAAWEHWRIEANEYRVLDDERVLVFTRIDGRGKASGVALGQMHGRSVTLFHVRSGRVTRLVVYWNADRARTDLGLAPEPPPTATAAAKE